MAAPPAPADEIRGLHLLYVKEVAAASSLAASPAAGGAAAPAAAPAAAAPAAPASAASLGGAADPPELYVGEDNKLYGIDGTQLVRMNVDAGNLVRVADAAAHSEKKDADEDVITGKEYKSAETAAVRHARKALTTLEGRFPMIENIGDLRARLEECCRGIAAAPGAGAGAAARLEGAAGAEVALRREIEELRRQLRDAVAASAGAAPPGGPAAGAVDVIKLLTDDINNNILGNIFNLHVDIKKELLKIFDIVKDLKNGNDVNIDVQRQPFNDANALLTNLNNYFHECNATLGIGYRIMNGNEDFRKLLDKLDKSIQLGVLFHEACRKFMDVTWFMMRDANANYDYYDTLEEKFTAAIDLHTRYIEENQYEDNADVTEAAVKEAYGAIKYEEEGGDGGDEEEGKEEEEEEEGEEEENSNNGRSVVSGGTEEGKKEGDNSNNDSSVGSDGTEEGKKEGDNSNNDSSVGSDGTEEGKEEEEEEENGNNDSSVGSGGTEEGKKEGDNSNNGSSVGSDGTEEGKEEEEEEENGNNDSSVGSGSSANIDKMAAAMNKEYGTPVAAAAPNPRKPQSGGARNRRVTPIGKKIGGISIKKRTPKKKSRSKK